MARIRFTNGTPARQAVEVEAGTSILDAAETCGARVGHACGGNLACSTCHVWVEQGFDSLSEIVDKEYDIMDKAFDVRPESRLACQALVADEFSRASTYQQPRTITLEGKFQGAPVIAPWTGYAVCVTSKTGKRRIERGPTTVLLDYDETLEVLSLSTGTPKWDAKTLETPYLRVENNRVSDVIQAETQDHVPVEIRVAYRVDFEGDPMRWFAVADYVKLLCDHVRSLVKGQVWRHKIEELHATAVDKVRGETDQLRLVSRYLDEIHGGKDDEV